MVFLNEGFPYRQNTTLQNEFNSEADLKSHNVSIACGFYDQIDVETKCTRVTEPGPSKPQYSDVLDVWRLQICAGAG